MKSEFDAITVKYISPILLQYSNWVLAEAKKLGINHLYFLARDGYQVYNIANTKHDSICCSYFYCSRYALRMAAYRFFDDSAYERLFIPAFQLTAENMLKRAGFDSFERLKIYDEIGFDGNETDVMGRSEFSKYCNAVRNSIYFNDKLKEKSDRAYENTIAYIKQENMHNCNRIGIVDLGWTGSMQHTLKRLLDSIGVNAELHGFYIGMLDKPPEVQENLYHTWLFDERDYSTKAWFAHNLLECICSAPHGMTTGYINKSDKIVPVLADNENNSALAERIKNITLRYSSKHNYEYKPEFKHKALKLLRSLMFSPTIKETCSLSQYRFCDDVGEQYHRSIIQKVGYLEYLKEILPFKLLSVESADGLYWFCGSLAASNVPFKFGLKYGYFYTRRLLSLVRTR